MLFKYRTSEFLNLRKLLIDFFNSLINRSNTLENEVELIKLFSEILDSKNITQLYKLDNANLIYNSWINPNEACNGNWLSLENSLLHTIYENGAIIQNQISKIYDSLFLVLYADFYEASIILENEDDRNYFDQISRKLLYRSLNLSEETLKKLKFLWMEIPKKMFERHLGILFDREVIETIQLLKNNQNFVDNTITISHGLKENISQIQESLEEQRSEYNFVGLSKGFMNLKNQKLKELKTQNIIYYSIMAILILLIVIKSYWSITFLESNSFDSFLFLIPTISMLLVIFIMLYFFKISLVNIKSIKSQILQIDLRLTLCQFIHNYEADTVSLRSNEMKESFEKFESVIFAPIVANEDQIPTTFDGLEQLANLLNTFNRNSR